MTIRSAPKEPTERDGHARFILESHANPGSACNAIPDPAAWLQPAHRPLAERRPAKRPASRDEPQGRRSGTPIHREGAVRSSRAMNPPGGDPRTEPRSASRLRTILQDPSSLHLFKNRQTSGPMTRAATSLLSSWITHPTILTTQPHKTGVVELVGIEPTTPCLQSRCSPS